MDHIADRRSVRRRSLFLRAKIFWPGLTGDVDCSIQDASRAGCQIVSDNIGEMPEVISVMFCSLGETREGRIVWRKGNTAGVEFTEETAQASA